MEFSKLFDINFTHDYYDGRFSDVACIPLPATRKKLSAGGIRPLMRLGQYSLFYEASDTSPNTAKLPLNVGCWCFALTVVNPTFASVTELSLASNRISVYRNKLNPLALDDEQQYIRVGNRFSYTLSQTKRPLTLSVLDENDALVQTHLLETDDASSSFSLLFASLACGVYKIKESSSDGDSVSEVIYLPHLPLSCFAVVMLDHSPSFYSDNVSFELHFTARQDTLNYYIVASNYANSDIQALDLNDAGFSEQSREQIIFNKVDAAAFTSQQIDIDLLTTSNANVVLFTSQSAVSRRLQGPKKLQLRLDSEVLIANLPTPGSSQVSADFFIHVAKP